MFQICQIFLLTTTHFLVSFSLLSSWLFIAISADIWKLRNSSISVKIIGKVVLCKLGIRDSEKLRRTTYI